MSELPQDASMESETQQVGAGETANVAPAEPARPQTVGQVLRAAREAAGLTVAEVAHTLKFSPRQIDLLEADNYAALPGNTIVRGFVRSYGKLLKLDVDRLLLLLEPRSPSTLADVRPPDNMGEADELEKSRPFSLLASVAIVMALTAGLLALWHFFGPSAKPLVKSAGEVAAPAPVAPPASTTSTAPEATMPPTLPSMAQAGVPATPEPAPAAPTLPPPDPTLRFVFSGRSWLEVADATRQKLHIGEGKAGSDVVLTGKPPFDIIIGNAGRVKLIYGEKEIDLAPHTRAEVARFRLE